MNKSVGLFAYGEMGRATLKALINNYSVIWIILPKQNELSDAEQITEKLAKDNGIFIIYDPSSVVLFNLIFKNKPDLIVISTFNKILPKKTLELTKFINVHIGDLPRYRGRANVNWAIINDRKEIGLTIHEAIPALDSGNIYDQTLIPILGVDTVKTIYEKINNYLSENIVKVVQKVENGFKGIPQKGESTYCCTRLPEDGLIDWNKTSKQIYNLVRALTKPYPGAFTYFEGEKMIIWESELPQNPKKYEGRIPGRIASLIPDYGIEVLTGDSSITIKNINFKGKEINASKVIESVKKTLGINWIQIYEKNHKG